MEKKKRKLSVPHTYVIIGIILVIVTLMTYVIPAGQYDRVMDEASGQEIIVTGSYHHVEQTPVGPFKMVTALAEGMVDASDIIFFCFFAYGLVYMMIKTGAFYGGVSALKRVMRGKEILILPVFMIVFGICGSTFGMYEEVYGLLPAFIGIAIAMGYDGLVGGATVVLGVVTGFAAATLNPFTIGIAQTFGDLPMFSGLGYRWVIFGVFYLVSMALVMRYAMKVKKDPTKSLVYGEDYSAFKVETDANMEFTAKHKLLMLGMVVTVITIVYGSLKLGWYINEMSGVFIISGILSSVIGGKRPEGIATDLITSISEMTVAMVVVGLSRTILVIMQNGVIIDTVIHGMNSMMQGLPTWATGEMMLVVQNILNFFIPSGSGQAAAIMPIMIPLADLTELNRQIAVLAYQFGDGFSNLLWPTGACAIMCGIAKIPMGKWYKFFLPIFGIMFLLQSFFVILAVFIGYH